MTKKQKQMLWNVTNTDKKTLRDVYKTCSQEKYNAYCYCRREYTSMKGFKFRITAANCHFFSCGFLYYDENNHLRCRYYTSHNVYDFIAE